MNTAIKTNELILGLNKKAIEEKYDVFQIKTDDKYFPFGAYILDAPELRKRALSVLFESGRVFYLLADHNDLDILSLKRIIDKSEGCEKITIEKADIFGISNNVIAQLMLNALPSPKTSILKFNNLTGHLYVYHPKWIEHMRESGKIIRIKCLELKINSDNKLIINVRTFTSGALRKKITFGKKKYKDYPKYILSSKNTLRRKLNDDNEKEEFILRQTDDRKSVITFLDISGIKSFDSSKMGVTSNAISFFNEKYNGYANISFKELTTYSSIDCSSKLKKVDNDRVTEIIRSKGIKIIDCISDEYSDIFCRRIADKLLKKYGVNAEIGKRLSKNKLNIRVIHNDEYYGDEIADPHDHIPKGYSVQHITIDDCADHLDAAITAVIHDVIIKDDIINKRISLYNWQELDLGEKVSFGIKSCVENQDRYFFMDISYNGSFEIKECTLDLFNMDTYSQMASIFDDDNNVKGVIRFENGDINIIKNTDMFTIPEVFKLRDELSAGNTYLRGKQKREELLSSVLDIKLYNENSSDYYFVGIIGAGMQAEIERASLIRMIEGHNNCRSHFGSLLPLMNIVFVRNGQLTVLPFPFKYLKEYVRMISNNHCN